MTDEQITKMATLYRTWMTDSGAHIFNDQTVVHFARAVAQEAARQERARCSVAIEEERLSWEEASEHDRGIATTALECARGRLTNTALRSRSSATGEKG